MFPLTLPPMCVVRGDRGSNPALDIFDACKSTLVHICLVIKLEFNRV